MAAPRLKAARLHALVGAVGTASQALARAAEVVVRAALIPTADSAALRAAEHLPSMLGLLSVQMTWAVSQLLSSR